MTYWTKATAALGILLLAVLPLGAKTDIGHIADQCDAGKQNACRELAKIAEQDKDIMARTTALERLKDPSVLAEIAVKDSIAMVRVTAVAKLTDPSLLAKIAVEDKDEMVRMVAVTKVADQSVLARVALEDPDVQVRKVAEKKVTDPALVAKIAEEHKKGAEVRAVVMDWLAAAKYQESKWSYSAADTEFLKETINEQDGKATMVVQVAFRGGSGAGIRFSSGSQMYFGATIGPASPLPMYGASVFPQNGHTYLMESQTFSLVKENGAWKISSMQPGLADPAALPMSPM